MRKSIAAGVVSGALFLAGTGAALAIPNLVAAADPTASPTTTVTATAAPTTTSNGAGQAGDLGTGGRGNHGGPGGLDADDLTAAAKALGMTEADLTTALNGGKTAAQVATSKGVALQKVIDAIVASDKAEAAAAVKAGTMTQAQADAMAANLVAHVTDEVNGVAGGPGGMGGNHGGPSGLDADDLTAAAKALGMTEADLTTALNGGKTAAAVATSKGVDVQKVIDAIVASDKAEAAAAVKAGTMTQAQADAMAANLVAHVTDEVNGVAGGPGGHGPDGQAPAGTNGSTSGSGTSG